MGRNGYKEDRFLRTFASRGWTNGHCDGWVPWDLSVRSPACQFSQMTLNAGTMGNRGTLIQFQSFGSHLITQACQVPAEDGTVCEAEESPSSHSLGDMFVCFLWKPVTMLYHFKLNCSCCGCIPACVLIHVNPIALPPGGCLM